MQVCTIRMEFEFGGSTPRSAARKVVKRACQNPRYMQVLGRPRIILMEQGIGAYVICVTLVAKVANCQNRSRGLLAAIQDQMSEAGLPLLDSRLDFLLLAA